MIAVYNETKTKWRFEKTPPKDQLHFKNGKGRKVRKKPNKKKSLFLEGRFIREYSEQESRYGMVQGEYASINIPLSKLPLQSLNRKIKKVYLSDKRRRPVTISRESVRTILTKEKLKRLILPCKNPTYHQTLLLLSLDKTVVDGEFKVKYNHSLVLDVFNMKNELSAVIAFPEYDNSITFMYRNTITKGYESKEFKYVKDGDKEFVNIYITPITEEEYNNGYGRLSPFIPFMPTYAIISQKDEFHKARKIRGKHEIFTYTSPLNTAGLIKYLKKQGYDAVTIFVDSKYKEETEKDKLKYKSIIEELCKNFNIVVKCHPNGFVERLQTSTIKKKY